jgi:site-specific recombinase XerD
MDLLHHGIDRAVIALWLGHESVETVEQYIHADMTVKERALEKTTPKGGRLIRYRPEDRLLAFLKSL